MIFNNYNIPTLLKTIENNKNKHFIRIMYLYAYNIYYFKVYNK